MMLFDRRTLTGAVALLALPVAGLVLAGAPAVAGPARCHPSVAGDANGDGRADPVIGVPGKATATGNKAGEVVLFRGTATGIRPLRALTQASAGVPGAASAGAQFGTQVAIGDITGNGCADVAITAPGDKANNPRQQTAQTREGSITVLYGKPGTGLTTAGAQLLTVHSLGLDSKVGNPACASDPNDCDFVTVELADPVFGDFTGDGHADLAAVVLVIDEDADSQRQYVAVVPGTAHGLDLAATRVLTLGTPTLPIHDEATPTTLTPAAGDANGDGRSDLAVAIGNGVGEGSTVSHHGDNDQHPVVDVLYGAKGGLGTGRATQVWDRESPGVPGSDPAASNDNRGVAVTFGDFNGDGFADLAVGMPDVQTVMVVYGARSGLTSKGSQVLSPGHAGLKGKPAVSNDGFGGSLAAGRLNGGPDQELAVGWSVAGRISVIAGSRARGLTAKGNLLWSPQTRGIPGSAATPIDEFGAELQTGYFGFGHGQDILVSDPTANHGAGSVTELFGSNTRAVGLTTSHARLLTEGSPGVPGVSRAGDRFGGPEFIEN